MSRHHGGSELPDSEPRRVVATGGPVDGTTWTITVQWVDFADGRALVTLVHPFRERRRAGGGFAAPVPEPDVPVHVATGRIDELPIYVLVRTAADVVSAAAYGTSGRRYDLELSDVDADLDLRFAAVLLAAGDHPVRVVARRADGRAVVERAPWRCGGDQVATARTTGRELRRRALTAAGAPAAGPGATVGDLVALAHGPRAPRERAAAVLCTFLRSPPEDTDPELRREAQRTLTTYARAGGTCLDLVGAHLVDLDLAGCRLEDCDFSAATFRGSTRFDGAAFTSRARFTQATFTGDVDLTGTTIAGGAEFDRATFHAHAGLGHVVVDGDAAFGATTFRADARFVGATVRGRLSLDHAVVRGDADLTGLRVEGGLDLGATDVAGHALFYGATVAGPAELGTTRVRGQIVLDGARAPAHEDRPRHWPAGWGLAGTSDRDGYRQLR